MSALFEPVTLRELTVRNRVWLAPMCQYSSTDGMPGDWHLVNLGARASGGFGLVLTEAAAVVPEGRITPEDAGLWNDEQAQAWGRVVDFVHTQGAAIGVQLAHAGRKASTYRPWAGAEGTVPADRGGWTTQGPSPVAFEGYAAPEAMEVEDVAAVVEAFAVAARRAVAVGFDTVEVHAAHGYLLHEFLSPLSNHRTDGYGGTFEGRARFVLETVDAVRAAIPEGMPLLVRISATDWLEGGWDLEQSTRLAGELREHGVDLVDVSSGGNAQASIPVEPGYQVPLAAGVRTAGVPTGAVGLITEPAQAEKVLANGEADVVLLARAALREPSWPLRAAHELGVPDADAPWPVQHARGAWR
ncbi:2,4-dienoyl-CoA reductase [Nocardioides scoriae]|uniref:2,4-dienoyl-CoA reductase n=1 Tax=Nocardioides scoriae TaxID=642780 RepID=A0A1H1W8R6_9ACTN|nr:NADH:flavin oxidoreductase/NADH oxidase [Nocardioides scoriae]SDS93041.1 2,4-dienoyl-CoA reductase [Nocardioides scoriae]